MNNLATRIKRLANASLGRASQSISLVEHNSFWKRLYADEAHFLYDRLKIEDLRLYHCGSTSIPGISTKPIMDILGSVSNLNDLELRKDLFDKIGYDFRGEYSIPGRRYYVLRNQEGTHSYVHLHFFLHDNPQVERHLRFRDYLRSNKNVASEYQALKTSLYRAASTTEAYTEAKAPFIQRVDKEAKLYFQRPPKSLLVIGSATGGTNTVTFAEETLLNRQYTLFDLRDAAVDPYSYNKQEPKITQNFETFIKLAVDHEEIIFATPVYWYAMSGGMKDLFDRFSDVLRGDGKFFGECLCGKRTRLIATGSDDRLPFGFEVPFSLSSIYFGMDYMGAAYKEYR